MTEITLLQHQIDAYEKLKNTDKFALFVAVGEGKTYMALNLLKDTKSLLIITVSKDEKSGKWEQHARDFGYKGEIHVVNYEKLRVQKRYDAIKSIPYDCIIVDECHSIMQNSRSGSMVTNKETGKKTRSWNDSKKVAQLCKKTKYVMGLTATFSPNNYVETFNILKNLDINPFGFDSDDMFVEMYYKYKTIPTSYGSKKTPTTLKTQTEKHLFSLIDSVAFMYYPKKGEHEIEYVYVEGALHEMYKEVEQGIFLDDTIDHLKKNNKLQQLANGFYYDIDNVVILEQEKQKVLKDNLLKYKADDLIVVYKYQEDLRRINETLSEVNINAIVLQISQSEAQNLQHCNRIIFYGIDFSQKNREQMMGRIMRINQKRIPKFTFLIRRGTIEEYILTVLDNKASSSALYKGYSAFKKNKTHKYLRRLDD